MTSLPAHLETLGRDLDGAIRRLMARRRRRSRVVRASAAGSALVLGFSAVAVASGIGPELQLDPTKWSVLGGGSVDDGQAEYVHAQRLDDGGHSTFMVEHDQGLDRYQAFLLHERLRTAADDSSPVPVGREAGELCTRAELTRAEQIALDAARADADVAATLKAAFGDSPCRGLQYAGEIAAGVQAGNEPAANLMPGVR
jgi:hypothetical protein